MAKREDRETEGSMGWKYWTPFKRFDRFPQKMKRQTKLPILSNVSLFSLTFFASLLFSSDVCATFVGCDYSVLYCTLSLGHTTLKVVLFHKSDERGSMVKGGGGFPASNARLPNANIVRETGNLNKNSSFSTIKGQQTRNSVYCTVSFVFAHARTVV